MDYHCNGNFRFRCLGHHDRYCCSWAINQPSEQRTEFIAQTSVLCSTFKTWERDLLLKPGTRMNRAKLDAMLPYGENISQKFHSVSAPEKLRKGWTGTVQRNDRRLAIWKDVQRVADTTEGENQVFQYLSTRVMELNRLNIRTTSGMAATGLIARKISQLLNRRKPTAFPRTRRGLPARAHALRRRLALLIEPRTSAAACLPHRRARDKNGRRKGRVAWLARENVAWRGVDVWMPARDLEQVAGED